MNSSFKWSSTNKTKETEKNHRCFNLAYLYFKNNDLDAAEKCARDSIAVDDTDRGHKLLGDILLAKKRKDEALLEFQRCIELNPNSEEAFNKVCDLMASSDNYDVESMKYWCQRAERSGLIDVVEKFQKAIESSIAFPGRSQMNAMMRNVTRSDNSFTNGSSDVLDTSSKSINHSKHNSSLNDTLSPSRVVPSPAERAILGKVNSQEVILKNILSQQEKLLDTHRILMQEILSNRGSIDTMKAELGGLKSSVAEVKAFAGVLGTLSAKLNDISEVQRELKDAFFELQLNSYGEDEDVDYHETEYNNENRQLYEPISPAAAPAPLNVQSLPNFGHMGIAGATSSTNVPQPTSSSGVFTRLGNKSSTPISTPTLPQVAPASVLQPSSFRFGSQPQQDPKPASASGKDVEVVFVKTPSEELVKKAESLELPKNFYNYLDKDDCKGCRGCQEEGTTTVTSTTASSTFSTVTTMANVTPKTTSIFGGSSSASKSLFGLPATTASTFTAPTLAATTTASSATTSIFGDSQANVTKPFSFSSQPKPSENSTALFGAPKPSDPKPGLFGLPQGQTSIFGAPAKTSDTEQPKSIFNLSALGSKPSENSSDTPKPFSFGFGGNNTDKPAGTGLFGAALQEAGIDSATTGFKWGGGSSDQKASWMVDKPSLIFGQKVCSPNEEEDDEENPEEDSVDDNLFVLPAVELPDQIEIKTGEEDEDVIYCQRAKLFRYDQPTKQWKERGIGDLKILKHQKIENRYRIVLRREQVHKIACNHYLTSSMKFAPMNNSETSVCWFARDFADEEYADEQFAVKFKTKEILQAFTSKIEELQAKIKESE